MFRHDCPGWMRMSGRCFWSRLSPLNVTRTQTRMHWPYTHASLSHSVFPQLHANTSLCFCVPLAIRGRSCCVGALLQKEPTHWSESVPWLTLQLKLLLNYILLFYVVLTSGKPGLEVQVGGQNQCHCRDCVSTFDNSVLFLFVFSLSSLIFLFSFSPSLFVLPYSSFLLPLLSLAFFLQNGAELESHW